jgi:transposase
VLPQGVERTQVDIWFQDEMRVGQQGTLTRLWAPRGTRPRVVRQQQYIYTYVFGAMCPARDEAVGLVLPVANTEAMTLHLQAISERVPEGRHALVVVDGAGWHGERAAEGRHNVSLLKLPPASPELNPVEWLWQQLRQRYLANRCFKDEENLVQACCEAWNGFTALPGALLRLGTRPWATLEP